MFTFVLLKESEIKPTEPLPPKDDSPIDPVYAFSLESSRSQAWFENRSRMGTSYEFYVTDFFNDFAQELFELPY